MNSTSPIVNVYPVSNYKFLAKPPNYEKYTSAADRVARMQLNYETDGMRRSVEGILLFQEHNHPHVLLIQFGDTFYKLPGGKLMPGENEIDGLKRKLSSKLAQPGIQPDWEIRECVMTWWRPNFDKYFYPYCPTHITKPKECKKLYVVHLPEKQDFAVPNNVKLLAVPLFDLFNNFSRYGPVISSIPDVLSRFQINAISP